MPVTRAKKRDEQVDEIRTINWFHCLGDELGTHIPRDIQRFLEPRTSEKDIRGDYIRNNKYLEYSQGLHVPKASLVTHAEQLVAGSSWELNHVLWSVLRHKTSIQGREHAWLRHLVPEIQVLVFGSNNEIHLRGGRHFLGSFERRASVDSLTALTVLLRMNHERGDFEQVWECAKSIFRVLLMLGNQFDERYIATRMFQLYLERIFNLVKWNGFRMYLETYNYKFLSRFLHELAERLRLRTSHSRDRKQPSYYAMQILRGERNQSLKPFFDPLIGPDIDIEPPSPAGMAQLSEHMRLQLGAESLT